MVFKHLWTISFRIKVTLEGPSLLFTRVNWAVTVHNKHLPFVSRGSGAGVAARGAGGRALGPLRASFSRVLPARLSRELPEFTKAESSEAVTQPCLLPDR